MLVFVCESPNEYVNASEKIVRERWTPTAAVPGERLVVWNGYERTNSGSSLDVLWPNKLLVTSVPQVVVKKVLISEFLESVVLDACNACNFK